MTVVRAAELVASGYLVRAKHPWKSGALAKIARDLGIHIPSDALLLRIPPPWSKVRDYLAAASQYQLEAMLNFGELNAKLAEEFKNLPKGERLEKRLMEIRKSLLGKRYGRKPKVKAPALPRIRMMLEKAPAAPATTAPAEEVTIMV